MPRHYGSNMVAVVRLSTVKVHLAILTALFCSVLGWVPGILTMVGAGILFWITSMTMHKFIMKYPEIKDICKFSLVPNEGSPLFQTPETDSVAGNRRFWLLCLWKEPNCL